MECLWIRGTAIQRVCTGLHLQFRHQLHLYIITDEIMRPGDWELFAAAIASPRTQQMFHRDLATWINETPTNRALTDLYDTVTGK